jgi:tyrosyl-tRNA synthetase
MRPKRMGSKISINTKNTKTSKNTGNFAYDIIQKWQHFDDPIKHKKKNYSPITIKNKIKMYLQKKSSSKCSKENCYSCLKTPNINKLKSYIMKPQ